MENRQGVWINSISGSPGVVRGLQRGGRVVVMTSTGLSY